MNKLKEISALVPRSLIEIDKNFNLEVNKEGFCSLSIFMEEGFVSNIQPIASNSSTPNQILFPRFVEPHAHFDKAFSWVDFPNLKSNYENALAVNLEEHLTRTSEKIINRAEESINLAIKNGYRAIRSHIDIYSSQDEDIWSKLFNLKKKYANILTLQFVGLAPLEFWNTSKGRLLAEKLSSKEFILGGVVVPPFKKRYLNNLLSNMLLIAENHNLEIDLHIDESSSEPAAGIKVLLKVLDNLEIKIPITCSHLSSILSLEEKEILKIGKKISDKKIRVVALPLTNFWLLNRNNKNTSLNRNVAPIKQFQRCFVDVSIGSDNVQDPWYAFGNFDPIYLMSLALPMLQLNPWERLSLSALMSAPSRLMNLPWDGVITKGCPADFVVLEAKIWADIFSSNVKRKVFINGKVYK